VRTFGTTALQALSPVAVWAATLAQFQQLLDADSVRQIGGPSGPHLFHSRSRAVGNLIAAAASQGEILYAEPDYILHTTAVPNDPNFSTQWGLKNTSVAGDTGSSAWDVSTGNARNIVAVVDTDCLGSFGHPATRRDALSSSRVDVVSGCQECSEGMRAVFL